MLSFLTMIFTLRVGLGATPVGPAVVSLRQEVAAVAAAAAEREASSIGPMRAAEASLSWGAPPRHALSKEDWKHMLEDALENETIMNAAMWIANQPVSLRVSGQKFFVTFRVSTP
jgi:hypothetical protein